MNLFNRIKLLLIIILTSITGVVKAQDTAMLQLQEAITAALSNNKEVQIANIDEKIATSKFKETSAVYLPQAALSYSAISTDIPLNAFGFKLQQKTIQQKDFNPVLLNNPGGTADFMSRLEIKQPLVNMDMHYQRKAAEQQIGIYQFKTQRTKEYISFQVRQSYMQLQLAYQVVQVLKDALQTSKSMQSFTNNRFQQGLLQKSDVLNARLHVTTLESSLAEAKSNIQNASDNLDLLMGGPAGRVYKTPSSLKIESLMDSTEIIPANRADFKATEQAITATDLMIKAGKMSYLPRLNAFGAYQLNDNSMLGFGAGAYMAGVQLSWDIFKGNSTKNKLVTQTLERDKIAEQLDSQKDQSQVELNKTYRQLVDIRFKIKQQQAAIELADEALRLLQNRYQQGLVNTTDVLMAETQLSQQKLTYAQALFSYNSTIAYIQFLTTSSN